MYCSSLYFLKAGSSDCSRLGSLFARALISRQKTQQCLAICLHDEVGYTGYNVGELGPVSCCLFIVGREFLLTSPGGADSTNDATVDCFEAMAIKTPYSH